MTRRILISLCAVAIATNAVAAERSRYIVATRNVPHAARLRVVDDSGESRERGVRTFDSVDAFAADLTDAEAAALRRESGVRWVQRVVERHLEDGGQARVPVPHPAPNASPFASEQDIPWGIELVHAPDLWATTRGRGSVNVAILDTGADTAHPDIGPNIVGGYNVLTQQNEIVDDNGHGTHVAGTIAALDNGVGVVGVAPEARIWAVKVLDKDGNGSDESVVAGIDKVLAWKHAVGGQWIVSLSLGSAAPSDIEKAAFQKLTDEDVLVVAAAGNRSMPVLDYPAGYPKVLSVAAIDAERVRASFSSYGAGLGVVAPGVKVVSTTLPGSAVAAAARVDGQSWITGMPFTGSPQGEMHGTFVFCGLGKEGDFPTSVRGNIALIQRGDIYFADKVQNAVAAGAVGAIIFNYDDTDPGPWTLIRNDCSDPAKGCVPWEYDAKFPYPPTISVSKADGQALLNQNGSAVTIGTWTTDYKPLNGTSMATPHVSGIAALLWTLAPTAHASDVYNAIIATAHDLGASGYDIQYGNGLVDALAAAKLLAPGQVGDPLPPPPQPPRRRPTH